ncbi:MAG: exodeoxyribonuclease III [Candidatus Omnitrophica bacterium]|nr:exodeoxyribonuclease III [Candidatus Omnitrophota bacterium]
MRLISWNVNGIRSIQKKGFLDWLSKESPDVLCLQETKASEEQLDDRLKNAAGYRSFWCSAVKKGYSGVALYTKAKPLEIVNGLGSEEFDSEGRTIMADFGKFVLFNIYFPNGGAGNRRVPFKMAFYDLFLAKAEKLRKAGRHIVVCGDVNTAHTESDLARPKENMKNTGFLPEERAWVSKFIGHGYVDTFRHYCQEPGRYTWWDYKTGARQRDVGWRIDYFFVSQGLLPQLRSAFIMKDVMGSDHCPVGIEISE